MSSDLEAREDRPDEDPADTVMDSTHDGPDTGPETGPDASTDSDSDQSAAGRSPAATDSRADAGAASETARSVDVGRDGPRPSTVITVTAVAFAVGAVAIDATYAVPGVLLAAVGVTAAVVRRKQTILGVSTAVGLFTVLLHGAMGGGPLGSVLAAGLFVFAWDQADHAFELDAHLGTDATMFRGELAHAAYSLVVTVFAGGGAYALALVASGRRPLPALVLLLLGAILLAAAIRDR